MLYCFNIFDFGILNFMKPISRNKKQGKSKKFVRLVFCKAKRLVEQSRLVGRKRKKKPFPSHRDSPEGITTELRSNP